MSTLPTGTVTFLFTDIEGSTKLLDELGQRYADVLSEHHRVIRAAIASHRGIEVDTAGDAFFVAFERASDAVAAAAAAQAALATTDVRVRMGIHTGEPALTETGYVGMDVHRASRVMSAGHGGQVLLSQATRDLLTDGFELRDLGAHRLKDLMAPQHIFQLGPEDFPALKSLNRTNLPIAATPLVGRERELGEVRDLLADGARLVTVTGAGGSGKTRLALQVGAELVEQFTDGVFFVPLAPVHDPSLVVSTLMEAVGIRDLDELRDSRTLLLIDNLEHLLPAAAELSSLLAAAPGVKLLVTSRAPLRVSGETEFALDTLPQDEAVELFLQSARAVKRDVVFDEAISEICRRLDGLPLALELAASRVKILDPPALLERLSLRLPVLTGGTRDAPERQQTLRATIEWSYELLDPPAQAVFRRLAVFSGSFSLAAAEDVAQADLDGIGALVDWSLIKPIGEARFLMLETIREYAGELLQESGEGDAVREGHLAFFLALAEEAEPNLTGPEQRPWYEQLALERSNIQEALGYACDRGDGERALLLSGAIWRFWWTRGPVDEAAHWYGRAFAVASHASPLARARGVFGAAHVAELRGDAEHARLQFEQAVELLREVGDTRLLILALTHLASAHGELGDPERSQELNGEALELARATGDIRGASVVTNNMAIHLLQQGDKGRAAELMRESVSGARAINDSAGVAVSLLNLASVSLDQGDLEMAAGELRESIQLSSSLGNANTIVQSLPLGAAIALARGDAEAAARLCAADEALSSAYGFKLDNEERLRLVETADAARNELGDDFDTVLSAGAELDLSTAVELALRVLDAPSDSRVT